MSQRCKYIEAIRIDLPPLSPEDSVQQGGAPRKRNEYLAIFLKICSKA